MPPIKTFNYSFSIHWLPFYLQTAILFSFRCVMWRLNTLGSNSLSLWCNNIFWRIITGIGRLIVFFHYTRYQCSMLVYPHQFRKMRSLYVSASIKVTLPVETSISIVFFICHSLSHWNRIQRRDIQFSTTGRGCSKLRHQHHLYSVWMNKLLPLWVVNMVSWEKETQKREDFVAVKFGWIGWELSWKKKKIEISYFQFESVSAPNSFDACNKASTYNICIMQWSAQPH